MTSTLNTLIFITPMSLQFPTDLKKGLWQVPWPQKSIGDWRRRNSVLFRQYSDSYSVSEFVSTISTDMLYPEGSNSLYSSPSSYSSAVPSPLVRCIQSLRNHSMDIPLKAEHIFAVPELSTININININNINIYSYLRHIYYIYFDKYLLQFCEWFIFTRLNPLMNRLIFLKSKAKQKRNKDISLNVKLHA